MLFFVDLSRQVLYTVAYGKEKTAICFLSFILLTIWSYQLTVLLFPTPLVSVIMPTYNREDFLPRSIESILKQDFKNFEFIIVDDGSTDDSVELI